MKMNIVAISGKVSQNAHLNGSGNIRALKFTIAANSGYDMKKKAERVQYVPCVLFNPDENIQKQLMNEGEGKEVKFQGNIITSSYEKNGARIWATEVKVIPNSFQIISNQLITQEEII
jgi:hypothetical protein